MSSYTIRHVDPDALNAFRSLCHQVGQSPNKVLRDFMHRVSPAPVKPSDEAILTAELHYPAAASPDARRLG